MVLSKMVAAAFAWDPGPQWLSAARCVRSGLMLRQAGLVGSVIESYRWCVILVNDNYNL